MSVTIGMRHPRDTRFWRWPARDMSLALILGAFLTGCAATKSEAPAVPPNVSDCIDCGAPANFGKRFRELRRQIDDLRGELEIHHRRLEESEEVKAEIFEKLFGRITETKPI